MRTWFVLLIIAVFGGFLLYRSHTLESRLEALSKTVKLPLETKTSGTFSPETRDDKRLRDLEAKYAVISRRLDALSNGEKTLDKNTLASLDSLLASRQFDERVLSVIHSEKQKIIEAQLKWHRDALIKYRMDALNFFANDQKLSSGQLSAVRVILEDEVDRMVEILRTPDFLSDPQKGLNAWAEMIHQTDKDAAEVLSDQQAKVLRHLCRLEQQAIMPWLPEKDRS